MDREHRATIILATLCLILGLLVNSTTLERTETMWNVRSDPVSSALVTVFQIAMIGCGVFLLIWRPRIDVRFLLLVSSLVLSFLVAETSFRLYVFGLDAFSPTKVNSVATRIVQPSRYREIGFELKPNLDTFYKLARFKTNSEGLQDQEYSITKPTNTFRVAVVGDSLTMPSGVALEAAYHSLLEERLNERPGGSQYELINFGVSGYSLRQYAAVIDLKVARYDPDLILIGFTSNDHQIPREAIFERPFNPPKPAYPFFGFLLFRHLYDEVRHQIRVRLSPRPQDQFPPNQAEWDYVRRWSSEVADFSSQNEVPVVIAVLSNISLPANYLERLGRIAAENDFHFLDVSRAFAGLDRSEYMIYPIDYHPNDKAQVIFAEHIYDDLRSQGLFTASDDG